MSLEDQIRVLGWKRGEGDHLLVRLDKYILQNSQFLGVKTEKGTSLTQQHFKLWDMANNQNYLRCFAAGYEV